MNVCLTAKWLKEDGTEEEDDICLFQENERLQILTDRGTIRVGFDRIKIALNCLDKERALEIEW